LAADEDRTHIGERLRTLQLCALYRRTITLTCPAGHVRRIDAVALWWMYARRMWDDRLPAALRRLYCARCQQAGQRRVRFTAAITRDPPDPDQPPMPDEREWKRVVSRHRA
jgi:hypothetical protein